MATRPFRPSNGSEGETFMAQFCDRCQRDASFQRGEDDGCQILAATMIYREDDPEYPPEWIEDDLPGVWNNPRCTAFEESQECVAQPGMIADTRQMGLFQ